MKVEISIVMTAYNRAELVRATLNSFKANGYDNSVEVIIVDDGSREPLSLSEKYPFEVRVIRNEPEGKWYMNPCIPYNQGFNEARGEKVVIQNAECAHRHNIVEYLKSRSLVGRYVSFGCYSLTQAESEVIKENLLTELTLNEFSAPADGESGWYNHSIYRPSGYHFCSALMKSDLDKLGGFDPVYAEGSCFDDDEFLYRVKESLQIDFCDELYVYHLWHYSGGAHRDKYKFLRNRMLYQLYTKRKLPKSLVIFAWRIYELIARRVSFNNLKAN